MPCSSREVSTYIILVQIMYFLVFWDHWVYFELVSTETFAKARVTVFLRLKDGVFSFQNNPKDLDLSYKMDLDLWDCLGMGKIGIIARFHRNDLVI